MELEKEGLNLRMSEYNINKLNFINQFKTYQICRLLL